MHQKLLGCKIKEDAHTILVKEPEGRGDHFEDLCTG
jgi:hypothetical protein